MTKMCSRHCRRKDSPARPDSKLDFRKTPGTTYFVPGVLHWCCVAAIERKAAKNARRPNALHDLRYTERQCGLFPLFPLGQDRSGAAHSRNGTHFFGPAIALVKPVLR